MKNALIVVVVLVLLGGGYYLYTQQNAAPALEVNNDAAGGTQQTSDETGMPVTPEDAGGNPIIETEVNVDATVATVKSFTVSGQPFSFSPASITVKKGDTVRITFKNTDGTHSWGIDAYDIRTRELGTGEQQTIEFVADKAGSFEYYCSVGTHHEKGMKGTLVVTN